MKNVICTHYKHTHIERERESNCWKGKIDEPITFIFFFSYISTTSLFLIMTTNNISNNLFISIWKMTIAKKKGRQICLKNEERARLRRIFTCHSFSNTMNQWCTTHLISMPWKEMENCLLRFKYYLHLTISLLFLYLFMFLLDFLSNILNRGGSNISNKVVCQNIISLLLKCYVIYGKFPSL